MEEEKKAVRLLASMLCADPGDLRRDIMEINAAGVDLMHVDIMDGHFVPNMTGGADVAACIREYSCAPCDFHLMVEKTEALISDLDLRRGERAAFHIENAAEPDKLIKMIHERGAFAGAAVNPGTPVSKVLPYIDSLDYLLVLIVNPGFKGQPVIPRTIEKLSALRFIKQERGASLSLLVDGAVTPENMMKIVDAGADELVCGPFTCFNKALGGIGPTLALVKSILSEHGCVCRAVGNGGVRA